MEEQATQDGVTMTTMTTLSSLMDGIVRRCQQNDPTLTTLELFGLPVSVDEVYSICTALQYNTYVEILDWGKHEVSHVVAPAVAQALVTNRTLKVLYMTECNIGIDDGLRTLCHVMKHPECTIQELHLRDNHINDDGALVIADMIRYNASVVKLDLAFNQITSHGAIEIANAIQQNSSLRDLDIGYNQIGNEGITALANTLKNRTSCLVALDMRDNKIIIDSSSENVNNNATNNCIITLADAIRVNKQLKVLDLGYNNLQQNDSGVLALANALRYNTTLETLGLCCCDISSNGSGALIEAIGNYNETLKSINLSVVPRLERMQLNRIVAGNRLYNRKAPKKGALQRYVTYTDLNNYWIQPIV